jgi:hypothetical protein
MSRIKSKKRARPMKRKTRKPRKPLGGLTLMNLKVSGKDRRALLAQADKYAKGNLSAWLRFAGTHFRPAKAQQVS